MVGREILFACWSLADDTMLLLLLDLIVGSAVNLRLVTNIRDPAAGQVGCPYAQRCWMALELKGVPYERVEIDLRSKPDWLLRISPLGRVPALITQDDRAVVESTVINEFLEETSFNNPLLPQDPVDRARQRVLVHRVDARFIPSGFKWLCYGGSKHQQTWQEELRFWNQALVDGGGPFFGGEEMGLADVTLAPFAERLEAALGVHRQQSMRQACVDAGLEELVGWLDRLWALPAFTVTRCESVEAVARVYEPEAVRGMSYLNQ